MITNSNNPSSRNSKATALGCSDQNIAIVDRGIALDLAVIEPWNKLCLAAKDAGFELALASGYRSFDRQKSIWDSKLTGRRPILDEDNSVVDIQSLAPLQRIEKLMRWSAMPGASRHHWGSDMDIYDRAAVSADYQLQLIVDEYRGNGPFAPLIQWLNDYLARSESPDFFFPYQVDNGGLSPEPWHLSYRPVAECYAQQWSLVGLRELIAQNSIVEQETALENIDYLYERFIMRSINP